MILTFTFFPVLTFFDDVIRKSLSKGFPPISFKRSLNLTASKCIFDSRRSERDERKNQSYLKGSREVLEPNLDISNETRLSYFFGVHIAAAEDEKTRLRRCFCTSQSSFIVSYYSSYGHA